MGDVWCSMVHESCFSLSSAYLPCVARQGPRGVLNRCWCFCKRYGWKPKPAQVDPKSVALRFNLGFFPILKIYMHFLDSRLPYRLR